MNILNHKFLVIIVLIVISGCRKDSTIEPKNEDYNSCFCDIQCDDFPKTTSELGYYTGYSGTQYMMPQFNPINDKEFVCIRTDENLSQTELIKVNLNDMSETVLTSSVYIISTPVWSETGWIVFGTIDWKIWKIRDDGTSLTQLTFGEWDLYPHFNYDGTLVYYRRNKNYSNAELDENPELYKNKKIIGVNLDGGIVDSITIASVQNISGEAFLYQMWSIASFRESEIYFVGGRYPNGGIYNLDVTTNEIELVKSWNISGNNYELIEDIVFINGFIYYSKFRNNLYRINATTGDISEIKCGCDQNYYSVLSISPSGDKLLVERIISNVVSSSEIDEQHEIWMMDLDGCNAVKILGD